MSPRAACRLVTLGFEQVYDYVPGKVDWMARGLPIEGQNASAPRAIDFARHDVVMCGPQDPIADVRAGVADSPYGFALVTTPTGILLGRLRKAAFETDPDRIAAEVMEPGPSTTRPDLAPSAVAQRLDKAGLTIAVLTDPQGRLLGIVRRDDLP